uniref:Roc domain-containing protein n=1 Tax=Myotis lucifugus TaxID=59463 RepID=G1PJL3_MYOLU
MAGMSGRPPSMYWCVGPEGSAVRPERAMDTHNGAGDMGSKLATPDGDPAGRGPGTEDIHAAYKRGDPSRARHLLREACDECASQREKGQLLSIAAAYGDLETVRYLLTERQVALPTEPTDDNPAVVAAHFGHTEVVQELLESFRGPCSLQRLLNWMLALACQRGHLGLVKLLVLTYGADPESYAVRKNEFPVIVRLPLYAAIKAGNEDIAIFLLRHGAFFCSYILLDSPEPSKHLLRSFFIEASALPSSCSGKVPLRVKWAHLKLPWVDIDWLIDISCQITELDLSANCLASLPSVVPWGLINLRKLNLSDNHLAELPGVQSSDEIICSRLLEVDISSNKLAHLPPGFLHLSKLQKLTASKNYLEKLFEEESATNWIGLRKLQELDVSDNKLTELPATFLHSFKSLHCLNVSSNKLKVFPDAWACPLKIIKKKESACVTPPTKWCFCFLGSLLVRADGTAERVCSLWVQSQALVSLKLQGNQLVAVPPPEKWTCTQLKTLDLSRNQFGKNEDGLKTKRISFFTTRGRQRSGTETACPLDFPAFLSESLEVLCLNDNHLDAVPPSVCLLRSLSELYLGNPGRQSVHPSVRPSVIQLQTPTMPPNVPQAPGGLGGSGRQPPWLRQRRDRGPPLSPPSTPPRPPGSPFPHLGLRVSEARRARGAKAFPWSGLVESIEFSVWDIGGPASMATVNQCFFTDKALYVVVWNLALGEEAVASLQFWLLNIEAKAPNAVVLVVGTHLDLIESKFRVERIATLRAYVLALCRSPSGSRATGFPDITFKHLHEISCKTLEGLEGLRQLIFHVTCNMRDVGSTIGCQRLVGRLVPRSYLSLQEAVLAEHQRRSLSDDVQYLTDQQLEQLVEQTPGNDISDYEDLQSGGWAAGRERGRGGRPRARGPWRRFKNMSLSWVDLRPVRLAVSFHARVSQQKLLNICKSNKEKERKKKKYTYIKVNVKKIKQQIYMILKIAFKKRPLWGKGGGTSHFQLFASDHGQEQLSERRGDAALFCGARARAPNAPLLHKQPPLALTAAVPSPFSKSNKQRSPADALTPTWALSSDRAAVFVIPRPRPEFIVSGSPGPAPCAGQSHHGGHVLSGAFRTTGGSGSFASCGLASVLATALNTFTVPILMFSWSMYSFKNIKKVGASDPNAGFLWGTDDGQFHFSSLDDPVAFKVFTKDRDATTSHQRAFRGPEGFRGEAGPVGTSRPGSARVLTPPVCLCRAQKDLHLQPQGHGAPFKCAPRALGHAGRGPPGFPGGALCLKKGGGGVGGEREQSHTPLDRQAQVTVSLHPGDLGCPQGPSCQGKPTTYTRVPVHGFMYWWGPSAWPAGIRPKLALRHPPRGPGLREGAGQAKGPHWCTVGAGEGPREGSRACQACLAQSLSARLQQQVNLPVRASTPWWSVRVIANGRMNGRTLSVLGFYYIEYLFLSFLFLLLQISPISPLDIYTPAFSRPFFLSSRQNSFLVLAGLADGLVAAFPVVRGAPEDSCSYLCSHTANRSKFSIPDEDVRQNPYPVAAMEVVNSGSEVWYSNGPGLLVIDCAGLDISRRLEPYAAPSAVTSLVCSSDCGGEEVVWCLDDRANLLVMYHSATYQLCARYFCGDPNPGRDVFPVRPSGLEPPDGPVASRQEPEADSIADVSIMYSKELGTQILTHQDSLTDYCSMSSYSSQRAPLSPDSPSSILFSTDGEGSDRLLEPTAGSDRSEQELSPVDGEAFSQHLQAVKVLAVKDVIWVPRRGGDVIVIGLERDAGAQRGRVIAVLKARELTSRGALVDAVVVAKDTVVCGFEDESSEWCLAVWRGWGTREFDVFFQAYEELGRLEACGRKRR